MVSLFFVMFLALTVFFGIMNVKEKKKKQKNSYHDNEEKETTYWWLSFFSGLGSISFLMWGLMLVNTVGTGYTIDSKIAMYEEENESIERSIEITVKRYMDYEASTYQKLKEEEAINLVPLIPELKSDALVQKQITIYVANNDKIKELKEEKIDLSKAKWQLYFGR